MQVAQGAVEGSFEHPMRLAHVGLERWAIACKLHGLRMLDPGVFSKMPLSSADSTNVARNVGIDSAWRQAYAPHSRAMRALILMERIERHASAAYWDRDCIGAYQNMQLFG